jgi:hypothetical protein
MANLPSRGPEDLLPSSEIRCFQRIPPLESPR